MWRSKELYLEEGIFDRSEISHCSNREVIQDLQTEIVAFDSERCCPAACDAGKLITQ